MSKTVDILGGQAEYYLNHTCKTIDKQLIHIPGPDIVDKVWINSDRNIRTLESLQTLYGHGRLANTGYVSILPVDQGIEHSAGASFAPNPLYFDPENIVKLAAADLTGQANHIGVTIKADIVKQKLPSNNGGFKAIGFGKTNERMYTELTTDHPIDLCRYQVANGYMGRVGLINSGGESHGESDLHDAVVTAVVNKRAGGMGLISGRKAFQKPMKDGVQLLSTIQDVYLDSSITIA